MAGVDQGYVVDVEACRYVSKDRSPLVAGLEAASIPTRSDIANVSSFATSIILFRGLSKSFSLSFLSLGVLNP